MRELVKGRDADVVDGTVDVRGGRARIVDAGSTEHIVEDEVGGVLHLAAIDKHAIHEDVAHTVIVQEIGNVFAGQLSDVTSLKMS